MAGGGKCLISDKAGGTEEVFQDLRLRIER